MKEFWGLLLLAPLVWELIDDHNGDTKHTLDVYVRIIIAFAAAVAIWILTNHTAWSAFILALAIHFFFFDYLENILLIRNHVIMPGAHWFTYLGKSSKQDKIQFWRKIGPYGRLAVRAVVLITAIYFYV